MKRLFLLICVLFLLACNAAFCGNDQFSWELQNKNLAVNGDAYKELIRLYNASDEANFRYLKTIRNNFENCNNKSCWKYVSVDDYTYKFLDNDTKKIILYNNALYK